MKKFNKKNIIVFLISLLTLLTVGLSVYFILKVPSKEIKPTPKQEISSHLPEDKEEGPKQQEEIIKKPLVKKIEKPLVKKYSKNEYNEDFFKNVWREFDIIYNVKKIDNIKKYAYTRKTDKKIAKSNFLIDKNALEKKLIKKPNFNNKKFLFSHLNFINDISIKENSWKIGADFVKYIAVIKFNNFKREVPIIYWTLEKAKKRLEKIDEAYLKKIGFFSEKRLATKEYIDNPEYLIEDNKEARFLKSIFWNRRVYLPEEEKAFPFYIQIQTQTKKGNGLQVTYDVLIYGKHRKKIKCTYKYFKQKQPSKYITFKEKRKKLKNKILLNKVFDTKSDLLQYMNIDHASKKEYWVENTSSGTPMIFMENIKLGPDFRLLFKDNDATFIDWRGLSGVNEMNTPFKGNMYLINFDFSNLQGVNLASITFPPLENVGSPSLLLWDNSFAGNVYTSENVYTNNWKMYDWKTKEKIHYNPKLYDRFNDYYNSTREFTKISFINGYWNHWDKLYKYLNYKAEDITAKEVKFQFENTYDLKSMKPSKIPLGDYPRNGKIYKEPIALAPWINVYLSDKNWDVFINKDENGKDIWKPNDEDGSLYFEILITHMTKGETFGKDNNGKKIKDVVLKVEFPPYKNKISNK